MTTIMTRSAAEFHGLNWPKNVVAKVLRHGGGPWEAITKEDVIKRKVEKVRKNLYWKREYGAIKTAPFYVWVFWCPGVSGFAFRGWWIALIGMGIDECKYLKSRPDIMSQLTTLFPLVEPDIFARYDMKEWKRRFVKQYRRGKHCGKPQGKAVVWAEIEGTRIRRLVRRGQWLRKRE